MPRVRIRDTGQADAEADTARPMPTPRVRMRGRPNRTGYRRGAVLRCWSSVVSWSVWHVHKRNAQHHSPPDKQRRKSRRIDGSGRVAMAGMRPRGYKEGSGRRRGAIATIFHWVGIMRGVVTLGAKAFPGAEKVFPRGKRSANNHACKCTCIAYM